MSRQLRVQETTGWSTFSGRLVQSPVSWARFRSLFGSWGCAALHPRLYAGICSARSKTTVTIADQNSLSKSIVCTYSHAHQKQAKGLSATMRSQRLLTAIAFIAVITLSTRTQATTRKKPEAKPEAAIRAVIEAQRDAWNRGDILGYMKGYQQSDETVFVSGDNVTRGWRTVLEHYQKSYDSREKMGVLAFSELEITMLADDAAVVVGRWHLKRAKDEPNGRV